MSNEHRRRNVERKEIEMARPLAAPAPFRPAAKQTPQNQEPPRFSHWTPDQGERNQRTRYWQAPRAGDIVETRFPDFLRDQFGIQTVVKTRPCLIVGVEEFANGQTVVKVAYGTSNLDDRNLRGQEIEGVQPGELFVSASDKKAGLAVDTKFSLRKVMELPFSTEYFVPCHENRFGVYPKRGKVDLAEPTYRRAMGAAINEARDLGSLLEQNGNRWRLKREFHKR